MATATHDPRISLLNANRLFYLWGVLLWDRGVLLWDRRVRRVPRLVLTILLGLAHTLLAAESDSDHTNVEGEPGKTRARSRGGPDSLGSFVRLSLERSTVDYSYDYEGTYRGPGASSQFSISGEEIARGWGGRAEAGVALAFSEHFALVPRGAFSLMRTASTRYQEENIAVPYVFDAHGWLWGVMVGGEMQFAHRVMALSADVGLAGTALSTTPVAPENAQVDAQSHFGPACRLGASLTLPTGTPWGVGLVASIEGHLGTPILTRTGRSSLSFFIQWDATR